MAASDGYLREVTVPSYLKSKLDSAKQRLTDPVVHADLIQIVKTVIAVVVAWLIAVKLVDLPQAFLAPWAALLTVHATVYRTLRRGVQQVGANVIGVLLAFVVAISIGVNFLTFGLAVLVALVVGRHRVLAGEGVTVATTTLVVLTLGYSQDSEILAARLLDSAIGIAVGVVVNFLVFPPLNDRSAAKQVDAVDDELGALFNDLAADIEAGYDEEDAEVWVNRTRDLDGDIDRAWVVVDEAEESGRLNFRMRRVGSGDGPNFSEVLHRLEQAVAETRSMARTLQRETRDASRWAPEFRARWLDMVKELGEAISAADANRLHQMRDRIEDLRVSLSSQLFADPCWPVYGAMLVNLRNISGAMDVVAAAQPVVSPRDRAKTARNAKDATVSRP